MNRQDFDWNFENINHIGRHGVTPEEAEQVFSSATKHLGIEIEGGELRYSEVGITDSGRILFLVWTERHTKVRIVTAFSPNARLKRDFLESGGM